MPWQSLLEAPAPRAHFAQLYGSAEELIRPLGLFVASGLQRREAAMLAMTPAHCEALRRQLSRWGHDPGALQGSGQLILLDAAETLAAFCPDGPPDRDKFFEIVEPVLRKAKTKFAGVRAFGEMVNLLWKADRFPCALRLETYWRELQERHGFPLLCAYSLDRFGLGGHAVPLREVCRVHTHLIPTTDCERFELAVSLAVEGILGISQATMVRSLVATERHRDSAEMPLSQSILLWLRENMPRTADRILLRAKSLYEGTPDACSQTRVC